MAPVAPIVPPSPIPLNFPILFGKKFSKCEIEISGTSSEFGIK